MSTHQMDARQEALPNLDTLLNDAEAASAFVTSATKEEKQRLNLGSLKFQQQVEQLYTHRKAALHAETVKSHGPD